jgi:hypothetical protein
MCVCIYIYNTWSYMASIVIEFNMKCLMINDDIYMKLGRVDLSVKYFL